MCFEEIFAEGNTILNKLDAHSLINNTTYSVFTNPMVRNLACYILKESHRKAIVKINERLTELPSSHGWGDDLEFVHMRHCGIRGITEAMTPYCPKLSTMIINKVSISHLSESFFKYMNNLLILDLSYNKSLESLPKSITNLRSLVSLILKECDLLKHVPPLGELQALSRLVISDTSIEEPPQGLEKLINLKWLDLSCNESMNLELGPFSLYFPKLQFLNLQYTCTLIMLEDVQAMKMLECFRGAIDRKHHNQSMQHNLDMSFGHIKTYHLILENARGKSDWRNSINLTSFFLSGDSKNRCIEFQDCDSFTHTLPKDHTLLRVYENNHWVQLCDVLSYSTSSSVRIVEISCCHELESLFCLFGSCSLCTNIHNLEILQLRRLESLTVICKDVVDVGKLSPGGIFSCLKEIYISFCHLIEKLLTPQLVQQLQNLETISVRNCNSMKEIFAVSNNDDNDSSIIAVQV
jgi:sentrin-specific protease 7